MDELRPADVNELLRTDGAFHLSLFMPTHRAGDGTRQDPIRFKNLLRAATERLHAAELPDREVHAILDPVRALAADQDFWLHQDAGLAVFSARDRFRRFRLPLAFDETVVVNRRFHVKPLLPLLGTDTRFFVLAVSQNETRVLSGSRWGIQQVDVPSIPASLADAMKYEEPQRELQYHTGTAGRVGNRSAIFHGHGADEDKDRVLRYLRLIDHGLHAVLRNEGAPLVLAAVDEYVPLYREANTHANLLDEHISGNPQRLRAEQLHERAWAIVSRRCTDEQHRDAGRVAAALGTGRGTGDVEEAVRAAMHGRVDTMFVARSQQRWGKIDPEAGVITMHEAPEATDEDLLDRAAIEAILHGGRVHVVEDVAVPGSGPVAAALRA